MFGLKRRMTPSAAPAASLPPGANAAVPTLPPQRKKMNQIKSQFGEVDTQPLWFRLKVAENTAVAAGVSLDTFTTKKNQNPHLTNLEEIGAMPNSAEFFVSAVEVVPNTSCNLVALQKFLAHARLVLEIGTKNFERINQPAVLFHSAGITPGVGLDNSARIGAGLYTIKAGEEIHLAPDQPFRLRFVADADGIALGAGEFLDCYVILRGQKRSKVSVG
jgi:hypothetical protein